MSETLQEKPSHGRAKSAGQQISQPSGVFLLPADTPDPSPSVRNAYTTAVVNAHKAQATGTTDLGPTLREQLRHVVNLAAEPHITFRVIPYTAGAEGAGTGAFTLFGTEKDSPPDAAFVESAEAVSFRDDPLTLRRLNRLFVNLSHVALTEDDSCELVKRIEGELNQ